MHYPKIRSLKILWIGGKGVKEAIKAGFLDYLELWGRRNGAMISEIVGRAGWLRLLPDYEGDLLHLTKDISSIKEH